MPLSPTGFTYLTANFQGVDALYFYSGAYGDMKWWLMDNFSASTAANWKGGSGNWNTPSLWTTGLPQPGDMVTLPDNSNVTLNTDSGLIESLLLNKPNTTLTVTDGGTLQAGYFVVKDGTLNVDNTSVGMQGLDAGGQDIAFTQSGGTVNLAGSCSTTGTSVEGGQMNIAGGTMTGGAGSTFQQSGGTTSVNRGRQRPDQLHQRLRRHRERRQNERRHAGL